MNFELGQFLFITFAIGFISFAAVIATSFAKISVVLLIVRNALGIQQTPPNVVVLGLAIVLTMKIMAPVFTQVYEKAKLEQNPANMVEMFALIDRTTGPWRDFLSERASEKTRLLIANGDEKALAKSDTFIHTLSYVIPAFLADELTQAFKIGLLIYICFALVDLIVGILLVAIGMQSMSATVISTPLKILLFVAVEGWTKLLQNLILAG